MYLYFKMYIQRAARKMLLGQSIHFLQVVLNRALLPHYLEIPQGRTCTLY